MTKLFLHLIEIHNDWSTNPSPTYPTQKQWFNNKPLIRPYFWVGDRLTMTPINIGSFLKISWGCFHARKSSWWKAGDLHESWIIMDHHGSSIIDAEVNCAFGPVRNIPVKNCLSSAPSGPQIFQRDSNIHPKITRDFLSCPGWFPYWKTAQSLKSHGPGDQKPRNPYHLQNGGPKEY